MSLLPTTRRRRWLLAAIVAAGALLRLWLWWRVPEHQPANDEVEYLQVARDLLAGRGWTFYERYHWLRAPLYSLWLAASLWIARGSLIWAALPSIALSVLTIWLFYPLGYEVGRGEQEGEDRAPAEHAGLLAAALASVLLTLATFAALWMAETLFTALFAGALLALLRYARRPRYASAALAGALLGLAILVRSLPLTWLPLAALWVGISSFKFQVPRCATTPASRRAPVMLTSVFVLCSVLCVLPWTVRNYLAYNAYIPVETGLSYNLWAFNEPREDGDAIFRALEAIPNPAERADYATGKGLQRLREDPAIVLRKLWPNWNYLWRVKPIEDRFLQRTYYEDAPLGIFALGLLLDDALYYAILLAALGGLLWAPNGRVKLLLGGWLAYVIAVVLVTHGEARYRHFLWPVLLPYAAWLIVNLGRLRRSGALGPGRRWLLAAAGAALLISPLVLQYPWAWAGRNVGRGWAVVRAEVAAMTGNTRAALQLYGRAAQLDPESADVWIARGKLYQRLGQEHQALQAFETAFRNKRLYVPPNVARADSLRRLGRVDEARAAFRGFYTDEEAMLDWSWRNLDTPPPKELQIGDGLDFGFVDGVYAAEQVGGRRARWTGPSAALRIQAPGGGTLRLTLSAPRPDGGPVPVTVCVAQEVCQRLVADAAWRSYALAAPPSGELLVSIAAPTFSPPDYDPGSTDDRRLGVLLDSADVE